MQCIICKIVELNPHPNADHLEIATISVRDELINLVVGTHYEIGTLGIYIPVGAIVPEKLAKEMWVYGRLTGKNKDWVASRKMYGVESSGLFYGSKFYLMVDGSKKIESGPSWENHWQEGDDVTAAIGVTFRNN